MNNTLSKDTISKLLREQESKKKDTDPLGSSYKERWPGEANLIKIAKAVKRNADYVLFRDGTRFQIKYDTYSKDVILIRPESGFVPMGYFSRRTLKEAEEIGIDPDDK